MPFYLCILERLKTSFSGYPGYRFLPVNVTAALLPEISVRQDFFLCDALKTQAAAKAAGPVWSLRMCRPVSVCMSV